MKKIILICLVVALFIAAGVFFLKGHQPKIIHQTNEAEQNNNTASSNPKTNQQNNVASSSNIETMAASSSDSAYPTFAEIDAVKIDKKNWQTYKDEKYGFEISAPAGWSFTGEIDLLNGTELLIMPNSDRKFFAPTAIGILYVTSSSQTWLKEYRQEAKDNPKQIMEIYIPTSDGAFVTLSHGIYSAFVKRGNEDFVFGSMDSSDNLINQYATMKAIIETFRFTK